MSRCIALCLLWLPLVSHAGDWSGELAVGYLATSGNTESRTSNTKAELVYAAEAWKNTTTASTIESAQAGIATAERYTAGNKSDFNLTELDYAFLTLEFEKDLFGPVRERSTEAVGYGRKVLTGPAHLLDLEIGAGAQQNQAQATRLRDEDVIGRARAVYRWNFSDTSHFGQMVKVDGGKKNTFVESVTEMGLSIVGNLFATASYTVRHNTDVPVPTKRTDTTTTLSLSWTFGKS